MRIFALIAAFAVVSTISAQAGDVRSLSLAGVDEKIPTALGKAAEPPKAAETPAPPPAPAAESVPAYAPRPSIAGAKPDNKPGQVTFDETKSAQPAAPTATTADKPKQAKADKPRRKRVHWDEARIMREIYRYSGYAGMIGGW